MRIPRQYNITAEAGNFPAGALFIEINNTSAVQITALFTGATPEQAITIEAGEIRRFEPIGAQGYAAFVLDDGSGGPVTATVIIIQ